MMNETQNTEPTRREKIKTHFSENKKIYAAGATGFAFGAVGVGGYLLGSKQIVIVDSFKLQAFTKTANTVVTTLARKGHPGWIVKDLTTGIIYPSQGEAARALGVSASHMSQHITGKLPHVAGHVLERVREAA